MANIMNLKDVKNHVSRNGFDLSRRNCFTASVGEILPVYCEEVLPGDDWRVSLREFMRTAPVQTATFGRLRQYYDFYFVPYRLLWDKFESWIVQTKNAYHSKDVSSGAVLTGQMPHSDIVSLGTSINDVIQQGPDGLYNDYFAVASDAYAEDHRKRYAMSSLKLLNALGYPYVFRSDNPERPIGLPGPSNTFDINVFPLFAYQKIYQDWFRFAQWEDAAPWTYNLDYIFDTSNSKINWSGFPKGHAAPWTLRYCNYDKDYFNGLLPAPQFGDTAIAGPLSGQAYLASSQVLDWQYDIEGKQSSGFTTYVNSEGYLDNSTIAFPFDEDKVNIKNLHPTGSGLALPFENSGLSVLILRQAMALQKWKEITMSGSPDYKEQLAKHWNVNVSDDDSYRCRYLGGIASNIDVSEVVNTNLVGDDSEAEIHGKGVSASDGSVRFKSHEYGIIMCTYHVKPLIEWYANNSMPLMNLKTHASDFAIPEFDRIGMDSVPFSTFDFSRWFSGLGHAAYQSIAGYAPRYIDYKTSYDIVHGEFQDTLKPWVIPHQAALDRISENQYALDFRSFKVPLWVCDDLFGVKAGLADQFRDTVYFNVNVVRNLDVSGLPY